MKKILNIIPLFIVTFLLSQNSNLSSVFVDKALNPTSNVASLGRYGDKSGVDNKGKYNTSIDLMSLSTGTLNYNLALSYSTNGLKLNDWGGRVGMQWSENFTSVIYRSIRGLPDRPTNIKISNLEAVTWDYGQFQTLREMCTALENNDGQGKDGESDIFYYNISGISGSFVVVNGQVQLINYSEKIKIEYFGNFDYFIITLKNGDKYYYGNNDMVEYATYDTLCIEEMAQLPKQKTSWFLTKIENSTATNSINFAYGSISSNYVEDKSESITIKNKPFQGDVQGCAQHEWPFRFSHNNCVRTKTFDTKYLTSVTSTNFKIEFSYVSREDIMNDKIVDLITIKNTSNIIVNKIKFNYLKTGNNNGAGMNWGHSVRYFLSGISLGNDFSKKYAFSYNNLNNVPARFSYSQDEAGIYNGAQGTTYLPEEFVNKALSLFHVPPNTPSIYGVPIGPIPSIDRIAHFPQSSYGLLENVTFPTGGSEKIFYEPNTVIRDINNSVEESYYGVRTKKIELWSSQDQKTTKEYFYKTAILDSINNKVSFGMISSVFPLEDEYGGHITKVYSAGEEWDCGLDWPVFYIDTFYKLSSNKFYSNTPFQGDLLSYDTVTEVTEGKKFTVKKYLTAEDYSSQPMLGELNSYTPNSEYFWYANKISEQFDGEIINNQHNVKKITRWGYNVTDYGFINNYTVGKNYVPDFDGWQSHYYDNLLAYSIGKTLIPNRWYNNTKITGITILDNGGRIVENTDLEYYDLSNYNNLKSVTNSFPDGKKTKTEYSYAVDLYSSANNFVQRYMVGIPLQTTQKLNDLVISKNNLLYSQDWVGHEMFMPYQNQTSKLNTLNSANPTMEVDFTIADYDLKGNILQYYGKDDLPVTIIYGYNQTLPILKVEGVAYYTLMNLLGMSNNITAYYNLDICQKSNLDVNESSEQSLLDALTSIRNVLANYNVTTYTYDPLIGVTSITPPSGIREVYLYDSANRLKEIRENNASGKLIKEFKYNYKP